MVLIIVVVLCFAIAFPVVTHWFGVATAIVLATLATVPNILLATHGHSRR